YRRYFGGGGLALYYLLREQPAGVDPLGPEAMVVITTSVIGGGLLSGANHFSVVARSPLTGGFGESEAGGYWGPEFKATGHDALIITGQAPAPVYLSITPAGVELRDAARWWGKLSGEVQDGLAAESGERNARVLQCGIAGENLVRYAALVNECRHFNGRGGMGAVFGAKRLKAVVVKGSQRLKPADPALAKQVVDDFRRLYNRDKDMLHVYGSARAVKRLSRGGILPTHNFREGTFAQADAISGETMAETILVKRGTCHACAVACKRDVEVPEAGVTPKYGGPEYETLAAHGSNIGIGSLKHIAWANQMCGQFVLDTISTGMVLAFAMECWEKGLITAQDTGGVELTWGSEPAARWLIEAIARREAIGDLLAQGVRRAAEKLGPEAQTFALHVKGQELPLHDPRGKKGVALAYATSPTGADHMEAPHDPVYTMFHPNTTMLPELAILEPCEVLALDGQKAKTFYKTQRAWSMYNTLGICDFASAPHNVTTLSMWRDHVRAVTGWDVSLHELIKAGERADCLARIFNVREGFTPADDSLPDRLFDPLPGPMNGESIDREEFSAALMAYYETAGWDPRTGLPTRHKARDLDLEWALELVQNPQGPNPTTKEIQTP
ncbi:MAG: aldehyde ferredoxin oxidoreductase family protein, partial [Deltaproteobacteria bacterium]|nr:aldehyde ferredoxin oxidoreductase family protein [Deltaproteobacteria bacterium]